MSKATTTKAEAVKENQIIKTDYAELIANGLDNNSQGQQFVQLVAHEMASGTTS
jgi:hypothetical protein